MSPSVFKHRAIGRQRSDSPDHALAVVHASTDLIALFSCQFQDAEQTMLLGGADEPEYRPASAARQHKGYNEILFTQDYFASALHEIAHWCLAGKQRRRQADYGYWYRPQRDASDQLSFEQVEARPQALEWIFSVAAGFSFQLSVDNLALPEYDRQRFARLVFSQLESFCQHGLPARAQQFFFALAAHYKTSTSLIVGDFDVQSILASVD